jgi:predicted nucleic acid-binding Zn ribbon protein
MKTRTCPICNAVIHGRTDKKYCSDQCRALDNNDRKIRTDNIVLSTNKQLRQNRSILKKLCPVGKCIVEKHTLLGLGYQFHLFTSMFVTQEKKVYYICYDIAIAPIVQNSIETTLIVHWKEFRKEWNPWAFVKDR